ncbi:MAG: SGNH/GDSL hydrolase family protein [Halanaerobiaceae bacterium]
MINSKKIWGILFAIIILLAITQNTLASESSSWVGTWATSPQLVEDHNMPPDPGLANNTLRQIVRVSIGGEQIRLKFSNQYGNSPMELKSVYLAESKVGRSSINTDTEKVVTFEGNESVTIPAGETVISDTIDYNLPSLTTMAISINFGDTPDKLTGHPGSRTTSYLQQGNFINAPSLIIAKTIDRWYVITGIDVFTEDLDKEAVVALGDSITDGRGSTTNKNNRWTDILAERLQNNNATSKVGVLNHGIGGNSVLSGGLGPTVLSRFDRDVIEQCGVRYLIIFAGVNDIGSSNSNTAEELIEAYNQFISKAQQENILVYGATILPFGDSGYYSQLNEETRQTVNEWIRTSGKFDAVIDFDAALRDPDNPEKILPLYDSGDHLHPSAAGYKKMGEIIDLNLFNK